MKSATVDQFVKARVRPEFRSIVQLLHKLMREQAPNAQELISYGIPAWKGNPILAVISPTKKDITFAFSQGAAFEDKYGLLRGVGHRSKHVKIRDLKEVNTTALKYYIKRALKWDAHKGGSALEKGSREKDGGSR
jgi:uncharacterized protein YdhG (YjbR/CyaY superfamily)